VIKIALQLNLLPDLQRLPEGKQLDQLRYILQRNFRSGQERMNGDWREVRYDREGSLCCREELTEDLRSPQSCDCVCDYVQNRTCFAGESFSWYSGLRSAGWKSMGRKLKKRILEIGCLIPVCGGENQ
jgi:hypothetical protein